MWFRRDLRFEDNTALNAALNSELKVLPLFIFDISILNELEKYDARVTFIYRTLQSIHRQLKNKTSGLLIKIGNPEEVWTELTKEFDIETVYVNRDYEPYARKRDNAVENILKENGIYWKSFKDQVIFEESEIIKNNGSPYTVFTPYKNKWLEAFAKITQDDTNSVLLPDEKFVSHFHPFPSIESIGFQISNLRMPEILLANIHQYDQFRDFPAKKATTFIGVHLRFGTVSIRKWAHLAARQNLVFLTELIWREFFMQILFHFPQVVSQSFKPAYDKIIWRNNPKEFERWCTGNTGYPIVDAGMRELNSTGFMHNRVRMITASFLCKHLLIDWRWGEAYFATKLFDYELSSNNGNWQWAAGSGCDAAPYFRVFNPTLQTIKFDPMFAYVHKWVPELDTLSYPQPIVEHTFARHRAIETYKQALAKTNF